MPSPRLAGVTIPLFSLRTRRDWGIGEIPDLPACAGWVQRAGCRLLQLLPVHELAGGETSPYGARTAFGLDPIYIGLHDVPDLDPQVIAESLGQDGHAALDRARRAERVQYGTVRGLKERVLGRAFERFYAREWKRGTARAKELESFIQRQRGWSDDLALYVALRERHAGYGWEMWPEGERNRDARVLSDAKGELEGAVLSHQYAQWVAHTQWDRARTRMRAMGVELMGDLPFIIGGESADAWARPTQFRRSVSLGAPPDAYSEDGQDWGLPSYDWAEMEKDDLAWIRERTRHAATLYDRFRLDHVIGYFRMYVKHPGQKKGAFDPVVEKDQIARGERVLSVMKEEAGSSRIVAEDLGVIPPFARETLAKLQLPGYRVIPWEKDDGTGFRDTRAYPAVSVATFSTHDTAPIVSWFDELPEADREGLGKMAGFGTDAKEPDRSLSLLRVLFESSSELALTLAAELLGQPDRINTPGTVDDKNWTYRLPKTIEELESDPWVLTRMDRIREIVHASGR